MSRNRGHDERSSKAARRFSTSRVVQSKGEQLCAREFQQVLHARHKFIHSNLKHILGELSSISTSGYILLDERVEVKSERCAIGTFLPALPYPYSPPHVKALRGAYAAKITQPALVKTLLSQIKSALLTDEFQLLREKTQLQTGLCAGAG